MGRLEFVMDEYGINNARDKEIKINKYIKQLLEKREWGKLVSKGFKENYEEMIEDSIVLAKIYKKGEKRTIVDIGSGGGIVGIPMSVICEDWDVTMVEISRKKSAFLAEMKSYLKLENAEILNMDAKKLIGVKEYDLSVTRAAGKIKDIVPLGLGLVKNEGKYLAIKGSDVDNEVKEAEVAIQANGGKIIEILGKGDIKKEERERVSLVVIEKVM